MDDKKHGDGVTNYERLLREVAPLMHEYEAQRDDYAGDGSAALIYERYRERPFAAAPDAAEAVSWALSEMRRMRERLARFEAAEDARGGWRESARN
jgi:class 3 adenylate cyclase